MRGETPLAACPISALALAGIARHAREFSEWHPQARGARANNRYPSRAAAGFWAFQADRLMVLLYTHAQCNIFNQAGRAGAAA